MLLQPPYPGHSQPVIVGRVLNAHGVSGEIRVETLTDVATRFDPGQVVYILGAPYRIATVSPTRKGQLVLALEGVNSRDAAQKLVEEWITIPSLDAPELPEGEYFHFQLLGLQVFAESGEYLGQVSEILETGSNDVYVVTRDDEELLIPALGQIIQEVNLAAGKMVVRLIDGLR